MLIFIIVVVLFVGSIFAKRFELFDQDDLWLGVALISGIAIIILGGFWINTKFQTQQALVKYNSHMIYIQTLEGKKINQSERLSELNAIDEINQQIANCKLNENDVLVGIWTPKIGYLKPIDFNSIPQAIDNKDLNISNVKSKE